MLSRMSDERKDRVDVVNNLGDILRGADRFKEAAAAYDKAVDRTGKLGPSDWVLLYTRGTVLSGTDPNTGKSLANTPADDITPFKFVGTARYTQSSGRFSAEYGIRAQSEVTRVATTLLDSPFLIAQDLLSLQGFGVQRLGWGVNLGRDRNRLGLTFAIENLTDKFYREQFQFAPARGRSFTVGLNVGAF